jgi:hypothetical protein
LPPTLQHQDKESGNPGQHGPCNSDTRDQLKADSRPINSARSVAMAMISAWTQ